MIGDTVIATIVAVDGDILTVEYVAPLTGENVAVAIPAKAMPDESTFDRPAGVYGDG